MMNLRKKLVAFLALLGFLSCGDRLAPLQKDAISPTVITAQTPNDTDDPAVWIHPTDPSKSLVIGTDKHEKTGAVFAFNLQGEIVNQTAALDRPNNLAISYNFTVNGDQKDIVVVTERGTNLLRIYSLPDLKQIDGGGIPVFEGEKDKGPMGIALYTRPTDGALFAVVGRKSGPKDMYLWQYQLQAERGIVKGILKRKFGKYSGKKEIEAIAVDSQLGYVYYSDETAGIRKYYADPDLGDEELAFFGQNDFKRDQEGIAIYNATAYTGYLIISNQQDNTFAVYPREGKSIANPHQHDLITKIPLSTVECDGVDATATPLGSAFDKGLFVAMSNGKTFHFYDWKLLQDYIDQAQTKS